MSVDREWRPMSGYSPSFSSASSPLPSLGGLSFPDGGKALMIVRRISSQFWTPTILDIKQRIVIKILQTSEPQYFSRDDFVA